MQIGKISGFFQFAFSQERPQRQTALAAVGLQPSRSGKVHFPAAIPPVKMCLERPTGRDKHENKNGISAVIATATTAACGRSREELLGPWPAGCKAHSRAVAYAGSHNPSRGEGCPEGERGESKHPSHPLAQRSDPGGDAPCKRHQTCPTRPPSVREATVRCRFSPPLSHPPYLLFLQFFA